MAAPNPEKLKLVKDFGYPMPVFDVAPVPQSTRCFFGAADFQVSEVDLAATKWEPRKLYAHGSYVTTVTLAGSALISGGYDGQLIWWDTAKNQMIRSVEAHQKWIRKAVTSPDGRYVASVADDMVCRVWDAVSGKPVHELKGHAPQTPQHFGSMLYAVTYSADGKYLATGDKVGHIVIWDATTGKSVTTLEAPVMYTWDPKARLHSIGGIRSLAFSPDGKRLAVGGMGKVGNIDHLEGKARVELFDWQSGQTIAQQEHDGQKGLVNRLAFAPDGSWLAAAGGGTQGFFYFLNSDAKKILKDEKAPMHVHEFSLSPSGEEFVLVGHNRIAQYKLG
ncbi:MAG: hypothetical protein LC104_18170 [Bacteroidales bacterium]|nr:hypothetical protein [Bacteroidales bacterium]